MEPPSKVPMVLTQTLIVSRPRRAQPDVRTSEPSTPSENDTTCFNHCAAQNLNFVLSIFFLLLVQISLLVSGQKRMENLAHVMEITWNLCRYKLNDRVI